MELHRHTCSYWDSRPILVTAQGGPCRPCLWLSGHGHRVCSTQDFQEALLPGSDVRLLASIPLQAAVHLTMRVEPRPALGRRLQGEVRRLHEIVPRRFSPHTYVRITPDSTNTMPVQNTSSTRPTRPKLSTNPPMSLTRRRRTTLTPARTNTAVTSHDASRRERRSRIAAPSNSAKRPQLIANSAHEKSPKYRTKVGLSGYTSCKITPKALMIRQRTSSLDTQRGRM